MKNWIIKLLGGYTSEEMFSNSQVVIDLRHKLMLAERNDTPRDEKTKKYLSKKKKKD
jgi:hypothetical protein